MLSLGSLIGGLGDNLLGGHSDTPGSGVGDVGLVYLCILFFQCISSKHYLHPSPTTFVPLTIMQVKQASRIYMARRARKFYQKFSFL